ncbi:MAG: hypothetical protein AAGC81_15355 [Pseudomonadota bacterium]
MAHAIKNLTDDELEALVGGRGASAIGDDDDDSNGGLLIRPKGPSATTGSTSGAGQFKIRRTNASGG